MQWPFYNVTEHEDWITKTKNKPHVGPGGGGGPYAGYARLSENYDWGKSGRGLEDSGFETFKFYIYHDELYNMDSTMECVAKKYHMKSPAEHPDSWFDTIDQGMSIVNREYFPEVTLIRALLQHPQRTLDPEKADMFFIGFSPSAALHGHPCDADITYTSNSTARNIARNVSGSDWREKWLDAIADNITSSKYFQRYGGRDHVHIFTLYYLQPTSKFRKVLDSGAIIVSVERYLAILTSNFPRSFQENRVIIVPYVSSVATDSRDPPRPIEAKELDPDKWWLFRGNMHRRGAIGTARTHLPALGKELGRGVDFANIETNVMKRQSPKAQLLKETARRLRESAVCLCPAGDSPTSLRLFEALAVGCLPVVMADKMHMSHDLPFPNLIDWSAIAIFTEDLHMIMKCSESDGLAQLARVLNSTVGIQVIKEGGEARRRFDAMRLEGQKTFQKWFSYFRYPQGVATGVLYEGFVLLKKHQVLSAPIGNDTR
jgi:hypothetical protein